MGKEQLQDGFRGFIVPVDIFDVPNIDWKEQMVYIVLRSFANPREATAFPSYNTIARLGRMSRSSAIRAVDSLVEKGLLKKELRLDVSKNRKIKNTSNLYTINTPSVREILPQCHTDTTLVSESNYPSVTVTPEHNHLTKPMNNNESILNDKQFPFFNWLEPDENQ